MTIQLSKIKYDVITEPLVGQIVCGDQFFIKEYDDYTLFSVIDGLGHGEDAFFAAQKAIQTLDEYCENPIETLVALCNEALLDTRGVAMTVGRIDRKEGLHYVGIGNVAGVCWIRDAHMRLRQESFILDGGIVGSRLPPLIQARRIALTSGDTIILATDGIKNTFEVQLPKLESTEKIAKKIFSNYRKINDDVLVLVIQLL